MKHRQFSDQFKKDAVAAANQPGINKSALARDLQISGNILHRWIREAGAAGTLPGGERASGRRGRPRGSKNMAKVQATASVAQSSAQVSGSDAALKSLMEKRNMLKKELSSYINA